MGAFLAVSVFASKAFAAEGALYLNLRSRAKADGNVAERKVAWEPKKTALIICDMWDDHWCKSAARRVGEMAGPLNDVVKVARARGVFIIHAPSTCTGFYDGTPNTSSVTGARRSSARTSRANRAFALRTNQPLLVVGLDLHEIKRLFLTESVARLLRVRPIRHGQLRGPTLSSENLPMISNPDRNFRFRIRGIHFRE
jgi:hypothetical protein